MIIKGSFELVMFLPDFSILLDEYVNSGTELVNRPENSLHARQLLVLSDHNHLSYFQRILYLNHHMIV